MATRKKVNGPHQFDRRVHLLKPGEGGLSPDNPFNEANVDSKYVIAYEDYPASRLDGISEIDEKESENLVKAISEVEWHLQYIPRLEVKSNWRIQDTMDGKLYHITSPITEISRGLAYRVVTNIVE